jgi:hypothetical protein
LTQHLHAALHSFLDLLAGLASVVAIALVAKVVLDRLEWKRRIPWLYNTVELLINLLAAAVGGYVTARLSTVTLLIPHTLILALILLALAALAALEQKDERPVLLLLLEVVGAPFAVVGGAWLMLHWL